MIRPTTLVCALMAFGSGLYLYQSKHGAELLDRQIAQTVRETGAANDRIKVLTAEWQLLNEPERLQGLAQQYLPLRPMTPTQVAAVADLAGRLPAALPASAYAPPVPVEQPADVPPALPAVPTAPISAMVASAAPRPVLRNAATVVPAQGDASIAFPPVPPAAPLGGPIVTASAAPMTAPKAVTERMADRTLPEPPASRPAPRRSPDAAAVHPAPPLSIGPAVAAPLAPAVPLLPRPALVQRIATNVAPPSYTAPVPASVSAVAFPSAPPAVTSALGMAAHGSLLPPPVPVH